MIVPTSANTAKVSTAPSIAILNSNVPTSPSFAVGVLISFAANAPYTTATAANTPQARVDTVESSDSARFR